MTVKEEKRNDILKATIKVISESGFEGAKIEDIAKEAGIGKGTVYEYFESKNALFLEMIRYSVARFLEGFNQVLAEGDSMRAKLCNLSAFIAQFTSEHLDMMNSSLSGQTLPKEIRLEMMNQWAVIHQAIETMVIEGMRNSELRANIDPEIAAAAILGGIKQYTMKKIFMDRERPEGINHEGIAKTILMGLAW